MDGQVPLISASARPNDEPSVGPAMRAGGSVNASWRRRVTHGGNKRDTASAIDLQPRYGVAERVVSSAKR